MIDTMKCPLFVKAWLEYFKTTEENSKIVMIVNYIIAVVAGSIGDLYVLIGFLTLGFIIDFNLWYNNGGRGVAKGR